MGTGVPSLDDHGGDDRRQRLRPVPQWVAPAFALFAVLLLPWIGYLAATLPYTARVHDRTAWVGFDIALMIMLALTAFLAWRGIAKVLLAATATATMLVVDAWFDVMTSRRGRELDQALLLAVVELTLAGVCLWIALHAASVVRTHIRELIRGISADGAPSSGGDVRSGGPSSGGDVRSGGLSSGGDLRRGGGRREDDTPSGDVDG